MSAKNNSGALFKNDRKVNELHPDYTGTAMIDGAEYKLSGWIKIAAKSGDKYLSLSFTPKSAQAHENKPIDPDEKIPF